MLAPSAAGQGGIRLRLAAAQADTVLLAALAQDMGLQLPDVAFDDMARGVLRRIVLDDGRPSAFLLAGDVRAHDALLTWADGDAAPASALSFPGPA